MQNKLFKAQKTGNFEEMDNAQLLAIITQQQAYIEQSDSDLKLHQARILDQQNHIKIIEEYLTLAKI